MDTKTDYIICEKCGEKNAADREVCISCGNKIENAQKVSAPAFSSITDDAPKEFPCDNKTHIQESERYLAPKNVFAEGLPSWNIEPPEILVRRR